jgi:ankyrin repeat protein
MSTTTELWEAIEDADEAAVRRILGEHPELLEATDDWGFTPLMHAVMCASRSVPLIKAILEAGADINRQTAEGYSALHCAIDVNGEANLNSAEVIGLLVSAGADLKARQHYGWTPLLRAVVEGTATEVQALLAAGADPNESMPLDTLPAFNAGRTTLMAAVTSPEADVVVEALLRAGADPNRRDRKGMNFFEYAEMVERESGRGEFAEKVKRCADLARRRARKRRRR